MSARRRKLKRDARGDFRPYIGNRIVNPESPPDQWRLSQHRFNLGADLREAELRYARIQKLYEDNCRACGQNAWSPAAFSFAEQIAAASTVTYGPPVGHETLDYAQFGEVYKTMFPSIAGCILPADPALYAESVRLSNAMVQEQISQLHAELKQLGALVGGGKVPENLITGDFHAALDAYSAMVERDGDRLQDGTLKLAQRKRQERAGRFKEHHEDFPLYELTFDRCKQLIDYWRNRPLTKRNNRCERHTARHHVSELIAFFRWLDLTDLFTWEMPRGVVSIKRNVVRLDSDHKKP